MGGVDHRDQLLSSYSIERRSKKQSKKVFYLLIEARVMNAYIIFSSFNPQHKSNRLHQYFREIIMHEMVQPLMDTRGDTENPEEQTM